MRIVVIALGLGLVLAACADEFHFSADDARQHVAGNQDAGTGGGPTGGGAATGGGQGLGGGAATGGGGSSCADSCAAPFPFCSPAGVCVECRAAGDCGGAACDVTTGRCTVGCNRSHDTCDLDLFPRGCRDDLGTARCTACEEDEHCGGATPRCAFGRGVCVECRSGLDCNGTHCDVVSGRCVP
jgi:hypothetical protein